MKKEEKKNRKNNEGNQMTGECGARSRSSHGALKYIEKRYSNKQE